MAALWMMRWRACHELRFGGESPYWSRLAWPDGKSTDEQYVTTYQVFAVVKNKMSEVLESELKRRRGKRGVR